MPQSLPVLQCGGPLVLDVWLVVVVVRAAVEPVELVMDDAGLAAVAALAVVAGPVVVLEVVLLVVVLLVALVAPAAHIDFLTILPLASWQLPLASSV